MADRLGPTSRQNWRAGEPATSAGRTPTGSSKRSKIIAILFVMLALLGAIAAWFFYVRPVPEPYFEAIWIDEYRDTRIPVNAWADRDRTALRGVRWQETNAFTRQERHLLQGELSGLKTKGDRPIVMYLSAHALTGENGEIFLLPGDAKLDDSNSWLPMGEVLRSLHDCHAPHKLLLLEIARPFVEPGGGVSSDVADRLKPVLEAAVKDDPRLLVLAACSPGQISWGSEDLGHSVFAYYTLLGLQGRADGWQGDKPEGRVSAQELITYVMFHVDRWSQQNRLTRQTPLYLGGDADFALVPAGSAPVTGWEGPEELPAYPPGLRAGWKAVDDWRSSQAFRRGPETFRQMQATLRRAEWRWRGGIEAAKVESDLKLLVERWEQQRKELADTTPALDPRSLAEAVARGRKAPALSGEVRQKMNDLAELDARVRGPKPDDKDKAKLGTDRADFLKQFEGKPFDLAWTVFQVAASETNPRLELVHFWCDLLRSIKPPAPFAETDFLLRVDKVSGDSQDWPVQAIRHALQTVRDAELVAAGDADVLGWVRAWIDEAQRKRQQGEAALFSEDSGLWESATGQLRDAARDYQMILRHMKTIEDALQLRDEAVVFLPDHLAYLEINAADEATWFSALQTTRELRNALAASPARSAKLPADSFKRIGTLAETLQECLRVLRQPFAPARVKAVIEQARNAGAAGWHDLNGLLDCPWLFSGDRVAVWKAARELSLQLQKKTAEVDQANDQAHRGKAVRPTFDGDRAVEQERRRALRRARWSIALLRLEGHPRSDELEKLWQQAANEPARGPTLRALNGELRRAWSRPPARE